MGKKLYQHLAGESEIASGYNKIVTESVKAFESEGLFTGLVKEYTPAAEGGTPLDKQEKLVVTTVPERLDWTKGFVVDLIDHELIRDLSNQKAVADLVINGKTIATGLPATFLLVLEKRLTALRGVYEGVPVLDASKPWVAAPGLVNQFLYGPVVTNRTEKKTKPVVLYAATDKHPAQVKEVTEDIHVGKFEQVNFSGAVTTATKAKYLGNLDLLIAAVKAARMRANDVEVVERSIGEALFGFING